MFFLKQIILAVLKIYRMTHVIRPPACRFYPTCSKYCCDAIEQHGVIVGVILTAGRLAKCHPYHPGGVDEVPG